MIVLSIDIGMKNLAHCLLRVEDTVQILDWGVVDLTETPKCMCCVKAAIYRTSASAFCKKHIPSIPSLQGLGKEELETICVKHGLNTGSRAEMSAFIVAFKKRETIKPRTMVEISRALAAAYERFPVADIVLVENQMAAKMAVVQGMVIQYWVLKGAATIEIVSPTNKLKMLEAGKTTYAERKKLSVTHTRTLLRTLNLENPEFETHKKKDDLADTFLQAIWYLRANEIIGL